MIDSPASAAPGCSAGTEVRLDAKGGPFENSPTQNQGELGVCFATTASRLLQSVLPGHPEISYLDLAAQTKELGTALVHPTAAEARKMTGSELLDEDPSFWLESGYPCDAFKTAKKIGACPRDQVSLENLFQGSQDKRPELSNQKRVMWNFSDFLDEYQKLSPIDRFTFRDHLRQKWEQTETHASCGPAALQESFEKIYLGRAYVPVSFRSRIPAQIQTGLQAYKLELPALIAQGKSGQEILQLLFRHLKVPLETLQEFKVSSPLTFSTLTRKITAAQASDRCRVLSLLSEMQGGTLSNPTSPNRSMACADCALDVQAEGALLQKTTLNLSLYDLMNFISETSLPTGEMIQKMLNPEPRTPFLGGFRSRFLKKDLVTHEIPGLDCKGARIQVHESFSCEQITVKEDRLPLTRRIQESLNQRHAVGASIRPEILMPDHFMGPAKGLIERHAITVAGYRDATASGQCERSYLILNSYGADCSQYTPAIRKHCDSATGKFWVPENDFFRMLTELSLITETTTRKVPRSSPPLSTLKK
ncbi:MAG: hypothetical protein H7222_06545 [Methylotenera sp.]|nr:hypothetical protein [Oligoflexia bacterium]